MRLVSARVARSCDCHVTDCCYYDSQYSRGTTTMGVTIATMWLQFRVIVFQLGICCSRLSGNLPSAEVRTLGLWHQCPRSQVSHICPPSLPLLLLSSPMPTSSLEPGVREAILSTRPDIKTVYFNKGLWECSTSPCVCLTCKPKTAQVSVWCHIYVARSIFRYTAAVM